MVGASNKALAQIPPDFVVFLWGSCAIALAGSLWTRGTSLLRLRLSVLALRLRVILETLVLTCCCDLDWWSAFWWFSQLLNFSQFRGQVLFIFGGIDLQVCLLVIFSGLHFLLFLPGSAVAYTFFWFCGDLHRNFSDSIYNLIHLSLGYSTGSPWYPSGFDISICNFVGTWIACWIDLFSGIYFPLSATGGCIE